MAKSSDDLETHIRRVASNVWDRGAEPRRMAGVDIESNNLELKRDWRRGLVLAGGGAKGAWQFGALQALREAGITFDVVSGTSVGALNGALWCADRMDVGQRMWETISLRKIFQIRLGLVVLAFFGLPIRVLNAFFQEDPPKDRAGRAGHVVLVGFLIAGLLASESSISLAILTDVWKASTLSAAFASGVFHGLGLLISCAFGILAALMWPCIIFFFMVDRYRKHKVLVIDDAFIFFCFLTCPTALFFVPIKILEGVSPLVQQTLLVLLAFSFTPPLLVALGGLLIRTNVSMFAATPLERIMTDVMNGRVTTPLFATAAMAAKYFDPDDVLYSTAMTDGSSDSIYYVVPKTELIPHYSRVDLQEPLEACESLLASSALPLGIVASRYTNDRTRLMDGGVVDNIPWFPLIGEPFLCDELFIVHCSPMTEWHDELQLTAWRKMDRVLRVIEAKCASPENLDYDGSFSRPVPTAIPFRERAQCTFHAGLLGSNWRPAIALAELKSPNISARQLGLIAAPVGHRARLGCCGQSIPAQLVQGDYQT
jgi:predicted acylesterase/phospholipase RssA